MGKAGGAATMHAGSGVAPAPGMHIGEFGVKMDTNLPNGMDIGELREKMNRSFGDIHCSKLGSQILEHTSADEVAR